MSKPIINRNEQEWNKNAKSKLLYKFYHGYSDENKTLHCFLSYQFIQFLLLFTSFKMQNGLDSYWQKINCNLEQTLYHCWCENCALV